MTAVPAVSMWRGFEISRQEDPEFFAWLWFRRRQRHAMIPGNAYRVRFRRAYKKQVRDYAGAYIEMGGVRRNAGAL